MDTLRYDHIGAYGYSRGTTPNIDRLAADGSRFANAWTPRGLTWPSLASMMTSWYPWEHGVRLNGAYLSDAPATLAEVLGGRGYSCAAFLTNAAEQHWEGFSATPILEAPLDQKAADRAVDWLAHHDGRFFLWVHLTAPHDPWEKQKFNFGSYFYRGPFDGSGPSATRYMLEGGTAGDLAQAIALYDGEIAFSDQQIGRIVEALGPRRSSTLVVIGADHGEELGDHPPYLHHFASLYSGVMRVPWVLNQPGVIPTRVVEAPVDQLDVAPTLLGLLGVPVPTAFHGRDVRTLLEGGSLPEKLMLGEIEEKVQVVRSAQWTYVHNPGGYSVPLVSPRELAEARLTHLSGRNLLPLPREALYDRQQDPRELKNLVDSRPEEVGRWRQLAADLRRSSGWPNGSGTGVDPALKERLEALGYWTEP